MSSIKSLELYSEHDKRKVQANSVGFVSGVAIQAKLARNTHKEKISKLSELLCNTTVIKKQANLNAAFRPVSTRNPLRGRMPSPFV